MLKKQTYFKHIVLFKIYDNITDELYYKAIDVLQNLGKNNPNIYFWEIEPSIDARKGRIIIEDALFSSRFTFDEFRTSKKHADASEFMRRISDWLVGDYEIDAQLLDKQISFKNKT